MPLKCKHEGCKTGASYSMKGTSKLIRCAKHADKQTMFNPRTDSRCCKHPNHDPANPTRASYNYPTENKPLYCKAHSEIDMINLNTKSNMCKKCKKKQPSYGLLGGKATHCAPCAKITDPNMVDLISKLCEEIGCRKNPTRGYPGGKPQYCKKHAERFEGMIDVKNKKCVECLKQPTFGVGMIATHCKEHSTDIMKDLKHSTDMCKESCGIRASYGYPNKRSLYCSKHGKDIVGLVDVMSKMCSKCGKVQAVFGNTIDVMFCKECSDKDMKNIKAKMCEKCGEHQPNYNYKGKKPCFCNGCKLDGMIDVKNPRCKSCSLFIVRSVNSFCSYCSPTSSLRKKTKEMEVVNHLEELGFEFIHNKSVGFVCGNYRPDIKIDAGTHIVIVEIDEDQHRGYEESCEIARMLNIHQAEGMRCVFIRYNPDKFRKQPRAKAITVQKSSRLSQLAREINKHMKLIPVDEITVFRMYYNNIKGEHIQKYNIGMESAKMLTAITISKNLELTIK